MNKIYKIFPILSLAVLLMMTGCFNDSEYLNNEIGTRNTGNQNFVQVHLTTSNTSNIISHSYASVSSDTTIDMVPVHLTSGPAPADMTVDFSYITDTTKSTLVDSLVNKNGFAIPATSMFTILNPNSKVVIAKGTSTGYIRIKFKPIDFVGKNWILAFQLTAVSDPKYTISNLDKGFVKINIKNKYDKVYNCVGVFTHPTAGPRPIDEQKHLVTVGANSNTTTVGDLGADYTVVITIDPVTNDVTYSDSSPYVILPSQTQRSYYEPSTGKFYLHYYYVGGTGNRVIDETYTPI